jgi:hypothetical protein
MRVTLGLIRYELRKRRAWLFRRLALLTFVLALLGAIAYWVQPYLPNVPWQRLIDSIESRWSTESNPSGARPARLVPNEHSHPPNSDPD